MFYRILSDFVFNLSKNTTMTNLLCRQLLSKDGVI